MSTTNPHNAGPPLWLLAELTYRCPLQCPYCSNPLDFAQTQQELTTEEWVSVLRQGRTMGAAQLGFSGGEPLVRQDLAELIAEARHLGYYTNLITSGLGLTEAKVDAFAEAAQRVMRTMAVDLNTYPGKLGHPGLRELMAQRERDREGVEVDPEHVVITHGSMQAVTMGVQAQCTGTDDLIVLEEYTYVGSIRAFEDMGIEMVGVPLDGEGMRIDALAERNVFYRAHHPFDSEIKHGSCSAL